jgi:hypothetical protein
MVYDHDDDTDDTEFKARIYCFMKIYKATILKEKSRKYLRTLSAILLLLCIILFVIGGIPFSMTTGKYQPRGGGWLVGIVPLIVAISGFRSTTHTGVVIVMSFAIFSMIISFGASLMDIAKSRAFLQLNACTGYNNINYFTPYKGKNNDLNLVTLALSECVATRAVRINVNANVNVHFININIIDSGHGMFTDLYCTIMFCIILYDFLLFCVRFLI